MARRLLRELHRAQLLTVEDLGDEGAPSTGDVQVDQARGDVHGSGIAYDTPRVILKGQSVDYGQTNRVRKPD